MNTLSACTPACCLMPPQQRVLRLVLLLAGHLVNKFEPEYAKQKEAGKQKPDLKRVLLAGNVPLFIFTGACAQVLLPW